jgi:hypothetical protein
MNPRADVPVRIAEMFPGVNMLLPVVAVRTAPTTITPASTR